LTRIVVAAIAVALTATACSSDTHPAPVHSTTRSSAPRPPSATASAEAQTLRARVVGRLPRPVSRAVGVLSGSRLVVLGGLGPGDVTTGRVVAVDPHGWSSVVDGSLAEPVHDASGAALAGHSFVFGGGSSTEVADSQSWTDGVTRVAGRLPSPRSDSAAVTIGGRCYVVGGFDGSRMTRTVVATTTGRRFHAVARLRQGVRYPAVAAHDGSIYVFGGQLATTEGTSGTAQSRLVQRIDAASGRTRVVGRLPWGIGHAMAFTIGARLYLAGGRRGVTATARIWQVDPSNAHLTPVGRLPRAISDSAVVELPHSVALIGGETTGPFAPQRSVVRVRLRSALGQ
jgi:N-acetylneuraminic acid mutarotase